MDPLLGFYAAVTRQDAEGEPPGGWYPDQTLTREEALRGFTLGAAYAGFMEDKVGSLAPGKHADFVILSGDIMTVLASEVLDAEVVATYLGGEKGYERDGRGCVMEVFGIEVGSGAWYLLTLGGGIAPGLGIAAARAWWRKRRR